MAYRELSRVDVIELVRRWQASERHRRSSFIFTSNRSVDEWLGLFDDPILGNSALDRLAHSAHQIVMEGPSQPRKGCTAAASA
jgi:DNA replication protein DnaC